MLTDNRERMLDSKGHPYTQSLFLEIGYDTDVAVYTLKENDHTYKGKSYPSIRRLYLELEDPTEYTFANTYFMGWKHWQRICDNALVRKHIEEWREELELKMRAEIVVAMKKAAREGNFQASKWMADKNWENRAPGRPSKGEKEAQRKIDSNDHEDYMDDAERLGIK